MAEVADGFVLAERDLALRGPGDFFGTRQSGMPTLRVGDLLRDHVLMEEARREASRLARPGWSVSRARRLGASQLGRTLRADERGVRKNMSEDRSEVRRQNGEKPILASVFCLLMVLNAHHCRHAEGAATADARLRGAAADVGQTARNALQCHCTPRAGFERSRWICGNRRDWPRSPESWGRACDICGAGSTCGYPHSRESSDGAASRDRSLVIEARFIDVSSSACEERPST